MVGRGMDMVMLDTRRNNRMVRMDRIGGDGVAGYKKE